MSAHRRAAFVLPLILLLLVPGGLASAGKRRLPGRPKQRAPAANRPADNARRTPERDSVVFPVRLDQPSGLDAASVLRASVVAYQHEEVFEFMWTKFFSEQRVGTVLLEPKWEIILPSTSLDDLKRRMQQLDPIVNNVIRGGGRVVLNFQCVPRWISSQPNNNGLLMANQSEKIWYSVPPTNYEDWSRTVQAFVQHFNRELDTGGRVGYMIGSEPENYWKGTEDEFFKYYQYAVKGALAADPKARIGGITPAYHRHNRFNTTGQTTRDGRPLLQNWIRFCRANNLPIDFVTWHSFPAGSPVPSRSTQWGWAKREIEGWLAESGYRGTELLLTDWPDWKAHPECDTEMKSAWAASGMISLLGDGLTHFTYLALRDAALDKQAAARQASFGGGNGLFTRAGIIKPVYNTFRLVSRMEGRIVPVDTGDDFVKAIASTDGAGKAWVLLSNFIPPDWLLPRNLFDPDLMPPDEEKMSAQQRKQVQNLANQAVSGQLDLARVKVDPGLKSWLSALQDFSARARGRRNRPMQVSFRIEGAQAGGWRSEEYVIDAHHANTFASLDRIRTQLQPMMAGGGQPDPGALRGVVEKINAEADVLAQKTPGRETGRDASSPSITTTLESNAVHLIVLTRQDR